MSMNWSLTTDSAPQVHNSRAGDGNQPALRRLLEVLVAVGSNVNADENIRLALEWLHHDVDVHLTKVSPFYQSPALDKTGHEIPGESYTNGAVLLRTDLDLMALRTVLRRVERAVGRERGPNAVVAVDLDIVMAKDAAGNGITVSSEALRVPAPDILTRSYLAIPLADIAPQWRFADTDITLQDIAASFAHTRLESITL